MNGVDIALPKEPEYINKRHKDKDKQYWERSEYPKVLKEFLLYFNGMTKTQSLKINGQTIQKKNLIIEKKVIGFIIMVNQLILQVHITFIYNGLKQMQDFLITERQIDYFYLLGSL